MEKSCTPPAGLSIAVGGGRPTLGKAVVRAAGWFRRGAGLRGTVRYGRAHGGQSADEDFPCARFGDVGRFCDGAIVRRANYNRGDYATALRGFRPLAEQGVALAQAKLGVMYARGKGVAADAAEAAKWFRRGGEQGIVDAQNYLRDMYARGEGVAEDDAEAVKWFRRAAEQGDAYAQVSLGSMYYLGRGVPKDAAEAAKWYRRAAEQGVADAQYFLGDMYDVGEGVPKDAVEAAKWYRRAAEQGHAKAQTNLGVRYYEGRGVPQNYLRAHVWANLVASRLIGEEREMAAKLRDDVAKLLSKSELGRAQRMAGKWRAKTENEWLLRKQ